MALWSGRFEKKMSKAMKVINNSLDVDFQLLPYDIQTNIAWAEALADINILTKEELKQIKSGLESILTLPLCKGESEGVDHKVSTSPNPSLQRRGIQDEDIHSFVERKLTELVGDVGKKIHTGRSRNDQVATDTRLYLRDQMAKCQGLIKKLIAEIVSQANKHKETYLPSFTHMQHAQPISLAHYLLSFGFALLQTHQQIDFLLNTHLAECPLGSGAVAGSAFPIDREKLAKSLGFDRPTPNSIHATGNRDDILTTLSTISISMIHLSRYAEDWIIWSSPEFGYVQLDESVSTGSSMMPQKQNPDSLELIRGKSARVIGNLQTMMTLMKGLPFSYARDMQEDKRPLFDSVTTFQQCLNVMCDVVSTMKWNKEKMLQSITGGLFATDLADYLVNRGVEFRNAHEIVATIVRDSIDQQKDLRDYTFDDLKPFSTQFEKDVTDCFDIKKSLSKRNLTGGTGPDSVKKQIELLTASINH